MSTTVDERVVEMRFDNKHFESNVATSMSTLDKLKQKLNLSGASKGLESINDASKKVNMSGLGGAVETVSAKFSALEVMGVTALANITNSAVNTGKRMISALTVDPVMSGFKEYETQINAVQTILANTSSKGTTINDVTAALDELNKYADLTIYNFTEMTRNIGTFTAAGIDLDTSVSAIQGIANLAAVSGSTSQQASVAMYQLSQALASGTVKLMDWNSVVNAGMGGEVFQNALKETSRLLGTGADAAIKAKGSFRESLSTGWLTAEVLTETLKKFTESGANEYVAEYTGLSVDAVQAALDNAKAQYGEAEAIDKAAEALAEKSGKNKDEIKSVLQMAQTATDAATKVKTFSQLWDVMKEAAQSGWAKTWQIIIGDFEEAKALLTPLADFFTNIINKMSDARNNLLESALGKGFTSLGEKINGVLKPATKAVETVTKVTSAVTDLGDIVNRVIRGDFGNGSERVNALTEAGINYYKVQNKVNETLNNGFRYTDEQIESQDKLLGVQQETVETTETGTEATVEITDAQKDQIKTLAKLSDAELKAKGYTDEQIEAFRELRNTAEELGIPLEEFIDNLDQINGRWLLMNSFKNIGKALLQVFKSIGEAWRGVFDPIQADQVFNVIAAIHKLTASLVPSEETADKLTRTFKGLFAILDIITTVVGGGIKIAFKVLSQILSYFHLDILDVTAAIGDALVAFHDWFESLFDISNLLNLVVPFIEKAADAINYWFKSFKASKGMQDTIEYINGIGKSIKNWWSSLKDAEDLPKVIAEGIVKFFSSIPAVVSKVASNIWDALTETFSSSFSTANPFSGFYDRALSGFDVVGQTIVELGKILLEKLNNVLTAHGFEEISFDAIAGLAKGLKEGAVNAWNEAVEMAKLLVKKVKDFLGIHSPSTVFAAIGGFIIAGLVMGLRNGIPDSLGAVKDVFQPMLDWIRGLDFGGIIAAVLGISTAGTFYKAASALDKLATPLVGLGSIFEGTGEILKKSAKPIAKTIKGFSKVLNSVAFDIKAEGIKKLGETLLMLVGAIIVLTFFKPSELWNAVALITVLALVLAGLAFAMSKINDSSAAIGKDGINIKSMSSGLIGIGAAILIMAMSVKMIGKLDPDEAKQGFLGLAGIVIAIGVVIAAFGRLVKGKSVENIDKFGVSMLKISAALLLMAYVIKVLGRMDLGTLAQGGIAIAALGGIIVGLMWATKLISGSKNVGEIGSTLLKIATAIGIMAIVVKMLGGMDEDTLKQGVNAILAFSGIIVGLMWATKLLNGSKNVGEIGGTLLKIAAAIGIMAVVVKMLGGMDIATLIKGGLAVTAFAGIIVGLMWATKLLNGSKNVAKIGTALLAVSGAIAIMALTAFMLSMISWEGFAKGTLMITAFSGIIVGLMAATKLISGSRNIESIGKTLMAVSGAIAILAGIAVLLGMVPLGNLIKGTAIVAVLAGIMAGLIAVTSKAKNCLGNLIVLTVMIAVLAGAVYLLSTIPSESAIISAIALGGLMAIMVGVLAVLTIIGKFAANALVGVMLLTTMAVPLLAFVGVLALMSGIQNGVANATALAVLIAAIGGVLFLLSLVGPLATMGVTAIAEMIGLIAILGVMATAIGALVTEFPQLQTFLDTGIPILEQLASGLGSIIGKFITSFAGEVMTILPQLGLCLSQFMTNATAFIVGAKMIDGSVLAGVGILSAAIIALSVAELISGVASFLTFGSSFADLGLQLSQFMTNALPFITTAALITPEMLSGVKALAETILILTAANVLQGLTSFITGGSSLATFAEQLPVLGQGISAFSTSLGSFTEEQLTTVNCAAKAIKTLAQASSEIPNTGGLLGQLVGENDLGTFAAQFPILGSGLAQFLSNVGTFSEEQVATVNCAAQAIKYLAQASAEIPNSGGLLGQLVGENDLGVFAEQFPVLGTGLRGFLDNVGTFTDEQVTTVDCAARAIKTLASAASEIPNSGGWIGAIVGENDLGTFADQFPNLGTGLRGFLNNVGTFTDEQTATVDCAANAVATLASIASTIPNEGGWISKIVGDNNLGTFASNFPKLGEGLAGFVSNLGVFTNDQLSTVNAAVRAIRALSNLAALEDNFGNLSDSTGKLPGIAKDLKSFCDKMPGSESATSAVDNLKKILSAIDSISDAKSGCLATLAENLKNIGKNAVQKFVSAFTSSSAKTDLKNAAKTLGDQVVSGLEAKEKPIKSAAESTAKEAVAGAKTQKDEMESAGKDLGSGLVNGINAKQTAVYNAGYALGQKAVQGEKDGQNSNSPSKDTIKAGKWLGEGLIIGIKTMGRSVYQASETMGNTAIDATRSAMSTVLEALNSDMNSQPTIRPVVDLSDVRSGASVISDMLSGAQNIGVRANLNAINVAMNRKLQNGSNDDVISAINRLNDSLEGNRGDTYNFAGITYDNGDEISNAVQTLVRAAKMGRRV